MTFLDPLDALIPKIPFFIFFFAEFRVRLTFEPGGQSSPGPDPTPKGGGGALRTPKWLYGSMGLVDTRDVVVGIRQDMNVCLHHMCHTPGPPTRPFGGAGQKGARFGSMKGLRRGTTPETVQHPLGPTAAPVIQEVGPGLGGLQRAATVRLSHAGCAGHRMVPQENCAGQSCGGLPWGLS